MGIRLGNGLRNGLCTIHLHMHALQLHALHNVLHNGIGYFTTGLSLVTQTTSA